MARSLPLSSLISDKCLATLGTGKLWLVGLLMDSYGLLQQQQHKGDQTSAAHTASLAVAPLSFALLVLFFSHLQGVLVDRHRGRAQLPLTLVRGQELAAMDVFLMVRRKKMTLFLDAKENTLVGELKKMVEGVIKVPPGQQRLYNKDNVVRRGLESKDCFAACTLGSQC